MQDFELWWLLLFPAFFGLGWLAARIDMKAVLEQARTVPESYFRSLHALLDEDSESATKALQHVVRTHPRAYELEMILGRLHRRRGENDLAIRLHQKMLENQGLPKPLQEKIQTELAQDFLKAGLVDRAETLFLQLENHENAPLAREARRFLLDLYQQERNWQRAIEVAQTLREDAMSYQRELAQFHCELAQSALLKSELDRAQTYAEEALNVHRRCARANLILGDIACERGDLALAMQTWLKLETQAPEYLALVAERLFEAYETQNQAREGLHLFRGLARTFPELGLAFFIYPHLARQEGEAAALEFLRDHVHSHPSFTGLAMLIEARLNTLDGIDRQDAELARHLISSEVRRLSVHRCKNCHFRSHTFYWRCPACNEWETFTPNRIEPHLAA